MATSACITRTLTHVFKVKELLLRRVPSLSYLFSLNSTIDRNPLPSSDIRSSCDKKQLQEGTRVSRIYLPTRFSTRRKMGQDFVITSLSLQEVLHWGGKLGEILFDGSAKSLVNLLAVPVRPASAV